MLLFVLFVPQFIADSLSFATGSSAFILSQWFLEIQLHGVFADAPIVSLGLQNYNDKISKPCIRAVVLSASSEILVEMANIDITENNF